MRAPLIFGAGGRNNSATGNPTPIGRALVGRLGENQFLVTVAYGKIAFTSSSGAHTDFLRVEEGSYENGVFKPIRIWNGDETDYGGLSFYAGPQGPARVAGHILRSLRRERSSVRSGIR